MNAVGRRGPDEVGSVVEDEQRPVAATGTGKPARGREHFGVGAVLDAQLHDVDAALDRSVEELVWPVLTDQVQASRLQALTSDVHDPSLAGVPR